MKLSDWLYVRLRPLTNSAKNLLKPLPPSILARKERRSRNGRATSEKDCVLPSAVRQVSVQVSACSKLNSRRSSVSKASGALRSFTSSVRRPKVPTSLPSKKVLWSTPPSVLTTVLTLWRPPPGTGVQPTVERSLIIAPEDGPQTYGRLAPSGK